MTSLLTPGLYRQPVEPVRAAAGLARGDIAVMLGYAIRGPLAVPVRVQSLRQFEEIFGPRPRHGFLWHAVKGFFETGGRALYVIRLATGAARAASVRWGEGPVRWQARAAFPWARIDPARLDRAERAEAAVWIQIHEAQLRDHGPVSDDPGIWGNALSVGLRRAARARTLALPGMYEDGHALRLASLAGIDPASVLELSQDQPGGPSRVVHLQPRSLDPARALMGLPAPLTGFDPGRAIRVTSVEFDLDIRRDGQLEQSFAALAPDPRHPAALTRAGARSVALDPVAQTGAGTGWTVTEGAAGAAALAAVDWADPASWPAEGDHRLSGGTDGLSEIGAATWLAALPGLAPVTDAALIAAPDLVLPAAFLTQTPAPAPPRTDCADLAPVPLGRIAGRVTGSTEAGEVIDLAGVTVDAPGRRAVTGGDGRFALAGLPLDFVTLRLSRDGFEPLEYRVQPSPFASAEPVAIPMLRITQPRALSPDEVALVQAAMGNPAVTGPYKVALIDPPAAAARLDDLAAWRARLGDQPRLGFFAPWVTVAEGAGLIAVPPSGHVAGAFAAAERAQGIQRPGANLELRHCAGVTLAIDDAGQAGLNPLGINAIRAFPGRGIRAHGTRTLGADPAARFLTVRRILDALERSLETALGWMVFEPNSRMTRASVETAARALLDRAWRAGVLAGTAPAAAYGVQCDEGNNPPDSRDAGRLVVDIAVAPAEPYEFILFRLGAGLDAIKVTETAS